MARIEWAALSGDEVETVVSMLIFNEHPRATRIRPSQGDFGIDVLVPHPGDTSFADVYQIKKFASNLDASQKRQIEDSFQRVLVGLERNGNPRESIDNARAVSHVRKVPPGTNVPAEVAVLQAAGAPSRRASSVPHRGPAGRAQCAVGH